MIFHSTIDQKQFFFLDERFPSQTVDSYSNIKAWPKQKSGVWIPVLEKSSTYIK